MILKRKKNLTSAIGIYLRLVVLAMWLASFISTIATAQEIFVERIAVIVNEQIILETELLAKKEQIANRLQERNIPLPSDEELLELAIDNMVMEMLISEKGKQLGITVDDELVNAQLTRIAQNNSLTLLQLQEELNRANPNAFNELRTNIRNEINLEKIKEKEIYVFMKVSPNELQNAIAIAKKNRVGFEYHVKQIMLPIKSDATQTEIEETDKRVMSIMERLQNGESFAELAVRFSKGPRALDGGDLGWLKDLQLPTFFESVIPSLPEGKITTITSSVGIHIVKLQAKRNYESVAKSVDENMIRRQLLEKHAAEQTSLWLQRIKGEAMIKVLYKSSSKDI